MFGTLVVEAEHRKLPTADAAHQVCDAGENGGTERTPFGRFAQAGVGLLEELRHLMIEALVFQVPISDSPRDRPAVDHQQFLHRQGVQRQLQCEAGFKVLPLQSFFAAGFVIDNVEYDLTVDQPDIDPIDAPGEPHGFAAAR